MTANPVWHRMLYSSTHWAAVGVKELNDDIFPFVRPSVCRVHRHLTCIQQTAPLLVMMQTSAWGWGFSSRPFREINLLLSCCHIVYFSPQLLDFWSY